MWEPNDGPSILAPALLGLEVCSHRSPTFPSLCRVDMICNDCELANKFSTFTKFRLLCREEALVIHCLDS